MEYAVIIICVIVIVLISCYFNVINKLEILDLFNEKINESVKSIDLYLEKKEEYLDRALNTIKDSNKKKYSKKNIMEDLIKNKNRKMNRIEIYTELDKILKELYEIIEDDAKLKDVKNLSDIIYDLKNNENDLMASIKFYNETIDDIKKIKKNVFTNIICKSKNYINYEYISIKNDEVFAILKEGNS